MKLFLSSLLLILSISFYAQKNADELKRATAQIDQYSEVYFKFKVNTKSEINALPRYISVDHRTKNNLVYAFVHKSNFEKLQKENIPFEVVARELSSKSLTMATTVGQMSNWDRYPTYSVYTQMMQDFATNYPDICRLQTIGNSQNGHLVQVLKITDNPDVDEDEPEFFYTGQMHGDELVSSIMLLHLIDYLLSNYGTNSQVDDLVNNVEIWINPLSNPDGCYYGGDNTVSGAVRSLYNGIDPNRNFPAPSDAHPDGNAYALEVSDMIAFTDIHNFVLSANIHSGAEVVNYPWDTWDSSDNTHADDNWWQLVSHEYADTVFANSTGSYFTDVSANGITEGGDWYIIWGGRQDYMTYFKNGREFTLELSGWKGLDADDLPDHWDYNYNSLLQYMEQSLYGIRGIITDSVTGLPIEAKVEILGHDRDNSHVYSNLPVGDYHRPIFGGTYDVTYSKEGYDSQIITINVTNFNTVVQNVVLHPTGAGVDELNDTVVLAPNPLINNKTSLLFINNATNLTINVFDSLGKMIYHSEIERIYKGENFEIDLNNLASKGVYLLKVQGIDLNITKRIIK